MTVPEAGGVIWLTGLSGAGKSTLAEALAKRIRDRGHRVEVLDGDTVRENLSNGLGFSREDRDTNIRRIAFVAGLLARNGVVVLVAAISPYRAARAEARAHVERFVEVHVDCALDELLRRDTKGLYARAVRGEVAHFTGISDPYEAPLAPDVHVRTDQESLGDCVTKILHAIEASGLKSQTVPGETAADRTPR